MKLEDRDVKSPEKVGAYLDYWEIEGQRLASEMNLDLILPLLGDKFDRESLLRYKENGERAVRAVVRDQFDETVPDFLESAKAHYRKKFTDSLPSEVIEHIVDNMPSLLEDTILSMVRDYQQKTFDPLSHFITKLEVGGRTDGYINQMRIFVAGFIGKYGRKNRYEETEILEFLGEVKRSMTYNSYLTRFAQLRSFLASLPNGGQKLESIVSVPKRPSTPPKVRALEAGEINTLILTAFIYNEPVWFVSRLLLSTVYGCRAGELAKIRQSDVDLKNSRITIPTEKRGDVRPQVIPEKLGIFLNDIDVPGVDYDNFDRKAQAALEARMRSMLRRVAATAGIELSKGDSFHTLRRGEITALFENGVDSMSIVKWTRWKAGKEFAQLPTYIKSTDQKLDRMVIDRHPFIPAWQKLAEVVEYQCESYTQYLSYNNNLE